MIYVFVILGILACACSQLLLKQSAVSEHRSFSDSIFNWKVILAYSIFFISLLINIAAFKYGLYLKEMTILESLGYIFVPILSLLFFKEKITLREILSMGLIIVGILIFYY